MSSTSTLRYVGAAAALIAGYAHIKLYADGYKDIPTGNIGTQFLLNALGAVAIAIGLVAPMFITALPSWITRAAAAGGVVWGVLSLLAYVLSHSDRGWMGFTDGPGFFNQTPESHLSFFPEIIVTVVCAAILALGVVGKRDTAAT